MAGEIDMANPFLSKAEAAAVRHHYQQAVPPEQRLTDDEMLTAFVVIERRRLYPPPLGNQLWLQKRKSSARVGDRWETTWQLQPVTGIDGLRIIAERSGKYIGSSVPQYEFDAAGWPVRAIVSVEKIAPDGLRATISADAWFEEAAAFSGKPGDQNRRPMAMWAQRPRFMLGKSAESQALRKAFPELSGLYSSYELSDVEEAPMVPAAGIAQPSQPPQPVPPARAPQSPPAAPQSAPPAPEACEPVTNRETRLSLAKALTAACQQWRVARHDLVALVRHWGARPEIIDDQGQLSATITVAEFDQIKGHFRQWYDRRKAGEPDSPQQATAPPPQAPAQDPYMKAADTALADWQEGNLEMPF